jgi:hypothetical protein
MIHVMVVIMLAVWHGPIWPSFTQRPTTARTDLLICPPALQDTSTAAIRLGQSHSKLCMHRLPRSLLRVAATCSSPAPRLPPARLDQEYQKLHIVHKALKADCQEARRAREIAETKMTTMDQQQRELMVSNRHIHAVLCCSMDDAWIAGH